MSKPVFRCQRCNKRHRGSGEWNVTLKDGAILAVLCPACQTPEENAEALINEATINYSQDASGRVRGHAKRGDE